MIRRRKRKTLPKDFEESLRSAPLAELTAIFDRCEVEATGGYSKQTALGFVECPDDLVRWLVEQGADVNAPDQYGDTPLHQRALLGWEEQIPLLIALGADVERTDQGGGTPLHAAAGNQKPGPVRALIEHGARVDAADDEGDTPLMVGLRRTQNADIEEMSQVAELLVAAGVEVTPEMREEVERIGREFEFHREDFNPDYLDATVAGLQTLYRLFGVDAAPARRTHDGSAPISVTATAWPEQHQELWELLVPSSGAAATVQGETIRITGRVAHEILGNGGINWDADFRAMLVALAEHLGSGTSLSTDDLDEARSLARSIRSGRADDEEVRRLTELGVAWVLRNPEPVPLPDPPYRR